MKHPIKWHRWPKWVHDVIFWLSVLLWLLLLVSPRKVTLGVALMLCGLLIWMTSLVCLDHPGKEKD